MNKNDEMRFYAERIIYRNAIGLHLIGHKGSDNYVAQPVVMQSVDSGMYTPPMAMLDMGMAQQLMDELWNCNIRPTQGQGSAGQLAAVQSHLADMKKLAFHALKVPGNG